MELSQGTKHDSGKLPMNLYSPIAMEETIKVLQFGAEKYEEHNWAKGILYSRVYDALLRHLIAFWRGEDFDPETKLLHLAHANCCMMFLLHYAANPDVYFEYDNRPEYLRLQRKS